MLDWLLAIGAFLLFLALFPRLLRRPKGSRFKGGASSVVFGIGFAFATLFDPKSSQAMEIVDQKQDESEDSESGDKP